MFQYHVMQTLPSSVLDSFKGNASSTYEVCMCTILVVEFFTNWTKLTILELVTFLKSSNKKLCPDGFELQTHVSLIILRSS